jgi:glycosyltransferase involved in cell wall biosynthesis
MKGLSVLSFGSTRGLWEGASAEDYRRLSGYATALDEYVVVAHSCKGHGLKPLRLAPNFEAIPTNAFCLVDSAFRMAWIGWRVIRSRGIDVIQAQDPFVFGLIAVLLGKLARRPANVCIYGPNVFDPHWLASSRLHRLIAPLGRWVLRRCAGLQVDGAMTQRSLVTAGIDPSRVALKPLVPANLGHFLEIDRERPPNAVPRLLFAGRLAPQKNIPLLVEVARQLKAAGQVFELEIVGEGPLGDELRAEVERTGLSAQVRFRGAISRDEIAAVFAGADILVLTSDFEGFPRVLMEAACAALPIVTTAVSGSDESITDGATGYIVPVGSASALVEKISALLGDPALRQQMGRAAREKMRTQLDPSSNTPVQFAIWQRLAAAARPEPAGAPSASAFPRRLLLFNLATDTQHPILGFTTQWIRELAARVESIHVITMWAGAIDVPANVRVYSAGRERGWSEPRRLFEFYRHLFRILREERIDGCFSHMIQVFSVLAGPVLRWKGIPLVTWYAHPKVTTSLKLAHLASDRMVTSLPRAYPYRHDKVTIIGQGIDTALFAPLEGFVADDDLLLCVGRLSRVKNHPTLLRAFSQLPDRFRLSILGATAGADDEAYLAELKSLASALGIAERVAFEPPVPATELPAQYRRCAVHVNLTPAGFGDKVAWEAMSCGRPCLVANDDFQETIEPHAADLLFHNADELVARLQALLARTPAERDEIGLRLRSQVMRLHSLPRLAERILAVIAECRGSREPGTQQALGESLPTATQ